jgi:hypothetical protein
MQKLAELNSEIENTISINAVYNESIENYSYNGFWVTELNSDYFEKKVKKIEKLLSKKIDYDNEKHIKYLKVIYKDVCRIYEEQSISNYYTLTSFELINNNWNVDLSFPNKPPKHYSFNVSEPNPANGFDNRQEYLVEIIRGFYSIKDKNISPDELKTILIDSYKVDEIDLIFAKANFSYIIWLHQQMVSKIKNAIENIFSVIQKLESFSKPTEENNLEEKTSSNNTTKIEFAMKKKDIAIFFHTLHELKIVKTDTDNIHNSQTKLKDFIDNSNIYYSLNKNLTKVGNIKKQFTELNNKEIDKQEIEFLNNIISKFETRLEEVKSRDSN